MAYATPAADDPMDNPSHSKGHRVYDWDTGATDGTVKVSATNQMLVANIADTGGTTRVTLAASSPHVTFTGNVRLGTTATDTHGINSVPAANTALNISPSISASTWYGISIAPSGTLSGVGMGVRGNATFTIPAGATPALYGLNFLALGAAAGANSNASILYGVYAQPGLLCIGSGKSMNITKMAAVVGAYTNLTIIIGTAAITSAYGFYLEGRSMSAATVTAFYGLRLEDFTNVSGTNYLIEAGSSTPTASSGLFRVMGEFTAAANETPVYISEGGTPTLRQLKTVTESSLDTASGTKLICYLS